MGFRSGMAKGLAAGVVFLAALAAFDAPCRADGATRGYLGKLAANHYVHSLDELQLHFESHVDRVVALGLETWRRSPEFREVDPVLVKRFLALHDQAKLNMSDDFVREFRVDRKRAPLVGLAQLYGKRIEDMNPGERRLAEGIRDEVNRIDHEVGMRFFRKHGLLDASGQPNATAVKLLRIEKIADTVDRAMSPVSGEEFHKVMDSSTLWLRSDADKRIAAVLERDYRRLTQGLSYESARDRLYRDRASGASPGLCRDAFALIR